MHAGREVLKGHEKLFIDVARAWQLARYHTGGNKRKGGNTPPVQNAEKALLAHFIKHYTNTVYENPELQDLEQEHHRNHYQAVRTGAYLYARDRMGVLMPAINNMMHEEKEQLKNARATAPEKTPFDAFKEIDAAVDNYHDALKEGIKALNLDALDKHEITYLMTQNATYLKAKATRKALFEKLTPEEQKSVGAGPRFEKDDIPENKKTDEKTGMAPSSDLKRALGQFKDPDYVVDSVVVGPAQSTSSLPNAKKSSGLSAA